MGSFHQNKTNEHFLEMKTVISNVVLLSLSNISFGQSMNVGPFYNCFLENYNPIKNTIEDCFSCFINAQITENLDTLRTCRKDFLPTAHIDCKDNESNKQLLDVLMIVRMLWKQLLMDLCVSVRLNRMP